MRTPHLDLRLPDLGSKGNWGATINHNFILIDDAINKLSSSLVNTQNMLGVGIPYYQELYDSQGNGPYKFVQIKEYYDADDNTAIDHYELVYYIQVKKDSGKIVGDDEQGSLTYTTKPNTSMSIDVLRSGTAAYVLNDEIKFDPYLDNKSITLRKGELLAIIQESLSLDDSSYGQKTFKVYPDSGLYIEPEIKLSTTTTHTQTQIEYSKKTYPDWQCRANTIKYSAVPAFYVMHVKITKSAMDDITIEVPTGLINCEGVVANFYTYVPAEHKKTPIIIDYDIKTNTNHIGEKDTITISITVSKNYPTNTYCDIYFGNTIAPSVEVAVV